MARRNPFERLPQLVADAVVAKIVEMIDVDEIVRRVDVNNVVERMDVNHIVERVDVNEMLDRVDVNAMLDRVDVDRLADRLDIDKLLERTEISSIISRSTTGALSEFLDLLRRQAVSVDDLANKLTRRAKRFPDAALGPDPAADESAETRQGHYAGSFSRLAAIVIDVLLAWGLFLACVAITQATLSLLLKNPPRLMDHNVITILVVVPFYFFYFAWQWALGGRTLGMAFVGIRVVTADGQRVGTKQSAIRILVLPFSIFVFGLGLLGLALRADRRGWHDLAAATCVVYDWDAKAARLRWLSAGA